MEKIWQNDLYMMAITLHPCYRTSWFSKFDASHRDPTFQWEPKLKQLKELWQDWKEQHSPTPLTAQERIVRRQTQSIQSSRSGKHRTIYEMNEQILGGWSIDTNQVDEFEDYIKNPCQKLASNETALSWWRTNTQEARWPILSKLAISILSLPPMSAEVERVFSGSRRTIPWTRASLKPEMIGKIECLKHCYVRERLYKS